jgi:molecular chaperone DnaK
MTNSIPSRSVVWSLVGHTQRHAGRLEMTGGAGATLSSPEGAAVGDELRNELVGEAGEAVGFGLARVLAAGEEVGLRVELLALGIDPALTGALATPGDGAAPPQGAAAAAHVTGEAGSEGDAAAAASDAAAAAPAPASLRDPFATAAAPGQAAAPSIGAGEVAVRPGVIIGIDLGTTNTCAAYVLDGRPQIIPGRTGKNTIPSMITFDPDGSWYVGQRAADRQVLYPLRTVYGSKRLVGRTFRDELAAELQEHFAYPLGKADGQRFGVRIDDRVISMDTIAARVLDEVRSTAEEHLKRPVSAAVITVPAYFTEVQREAVRRAAAEANLTVHRVVNEPTAAAVAYGHKQQGRRARVAVWDFGGGTFDFSIVDVTNGRLEVLTTGGDNFVGGSDFDDLVASHLLTEFQRAHGLTADPEPQQIARLREAAEEAKRALSVQTEHVIELHEFTRQPRHTLTVELTRERFNELTRSLIDRTIAIATEVMADVNLDPGDIDDVLLVGGTTRIPAVQDAVAALFKRRPSKGINPDEAVALGAALLANELGGGGPQLLDVLPMSIGHAAPGRRFTPILARNVRLPAQREVTFAADILGNVTMPIFQGESSDARRNEYLCSVIVEDRSLWDNGRVTLRISFDERSVMAIHARNARTGAPLPTRLDRTRPVEEIMRELGDHDGPPSTPPPPPPPPSRLGKVLGKLFTLFGR